MVQHGKNHYNWKGGRSINSQGYVMIYSPGHPRAIRSNRYRVREHILVMEEYLDRYVEMNESVHHINENKQDNRIENLVLYHSPDHKSHHAKLGWVRGIFNESNQHRERDSVTGRFIRL